MVYKKRYEYSPLEEIFFPKRIANTQYYNDEELLFSNKKNERKDIGNRSIKTKGKRGKNVQENINNIKDDLLRTNISLELCVRKKNYYLNTRNSNHVQNYFFFYDYRKCFHNMDGKLFIDRNPVQIKSDRTKRDERLNQVIPIQNYNTFMHAYNI
ncbi:hypothetical protein, conserved [Plasmodium gonderi]|uniref:Uncharacterized protein n=1 Tax=Plasmodium gonderi TaxID=77519 RepID=A0A1Y1JCB7_PLAGO|nr:hypothetical protein, conserved [Plasmodium gonderi]GAW79005.1 hypothetical protein, conserved [Plasmodium gonderi]